MHASRRALPLPVGLLALLSAACSGRPTSGGTARSANAPVVLVSIDTLRADRLPAYGGKGVETPALDRLQRDAILFENAYSHSPLTFPSHTSPLTGPPPPAHGARPAAPGPAAARARRAQQHRLQARREPRDAGVGAARTRLRDGRRRLGLRA